MNDREQHGPTPEGTDRFYGKYRGVVVDNKPDKLGCIKVTCENVMPGEIFTAMPCVPYAGAGVGFRFLPEVDDNVWVEFEAGDPSYPIWSGCWWSSGAFDRVEDPANIKIIQTAKIRIEIDDAGQGSITIAHQDGSVFEIVGGNMSSEAVTTIVHQVSATKTSLSVQGFDVNEGTLVAAP